MSAKEKMGKESEPSAPVVIVESNTKVITTVTVDNVTFRLSEMAEKSVDEISFYSRKIPLTRRATKDGENDGAVKFCVDLMKDGSFELWMINAGEEDLLTANLRVEISCRGAGLNKIDCPRRPLGAGDKIGLGAGDKIGLVSPSDSNATKLIDTLGNLAIILTLTIFTIEAFENGEAISYGLSLTSQDAASDLAKDILKLGHMFGYSTNLGNNLSDVSIICEDKKFHAHKTILAARSDVFEAMFQHENTKEAGTKQVKVDDATAVTVGHFLQYVYGGPLEPHISFEEADSLMLIGDKYNVKGLIVASRKTLLKRMAPSNYIRAAILGHLCNDDILKEAAIKTIVGSGKNIKDIEDYEELMKYPDLGIEMLKCYSSSKV